MATARYSYHSNNLVTNYIMCFSSKKQNPNIKASDCRCDCERTREGEGLTSKELWEHFHKTRRFELKNLWQRSIFLGAFLIIFYTGYGGLISQYFEKCLDGNKLVWLHLAAVAISLLGATFSVIWIKMAKSSKAWYEIYETRINTVEEETSLGLESFQGLDYYMEQHTKEIVTKKSAQETGNQMDISCFSTNPGPYSPSRLNILIGIVFLISWVMTMCLHLGLLLYDVLSKSKCSDDSTCLPILALCIITCLVILLTICLYQCTPKKLSVRSSVLDSK